MGLALTNASRRTNPMKQQIRWLGRWKRTWAKSNTKENGRRQYLRHLRLSNTIYIPVSPA